MIKEMPAHSWRFFVYKLFMYKLNEKNMKSKSVLKEAVLPANVASNLQPASIGKMSDGTHYIETTNGVTLYNNGRCSYKGQMYDVPTNQLNNVAKIFQSQNLGNELRGKNGFMNRMLANIGDDMRQVSAGTIPARWFNNAVITGVYTMPNGKDKCLKLSNGATVYDNGRCMVNGKMYNVADDALGIVKNLFAAKGLQGQLKGRLAGSNTGTTTGRTAPTPDERVKKMQAALNAAGYVGKNGKSLAVDGLLGGANSNTRFAAQQAGIDPTKWNGEPITPKQQSQQQGQEQNQQQGQQQTQGQQQGQEQNQQQQGQQQTQGQQQGFDYSNDAAYGKYLGGADARQIKKFQYDFGIEPETGMYDAKTAGKAYELAHDTNDNNFKRAGGNIKAYAEWNAYEAGGNAANTEHAQAAATQTFNTAVQELNAALDKYGKGNPAANERLNNIRNFIKTNNFEGAKQAANSLAQIGPKKTIISLIDKCAGAYAGTQGQQQQAQAVNEIRNTFNAWMDRINSATLLQS